MRDRKAIKNIFLSPQPSDYIFRRNIRKMLFGIIFFWWEKEKSTKIDAHDWWGEA